MIGRVAPAVAAACVLAAGAVAFPYVVDDAFIVARYARTLARGGGWAMNAGQPTDGVTGPLWIAPFLLGELTGLEPVRVAKLAGMLAGAAAAAWVTSVAARRAGGRVSAPVTAALVGLQATLGLWSGAGLETGVATLLLVGAATGAIRRPAPAPLRVGLCVAALAWLRPELAAASAVLLLHLLSRDRRAFAIAALLAAASAVALLLGRTLVFGSPLPLAFHAKPGELAEGLLYVARGVVIVTGVAGVGLCARGARRGGGGDRALGLCVLAHVAAVAAVGGDWMPGFRLLAPALPLYALLAGLGAARPSRTRGGRAWLVALVAIAALVPLADLGVQAPRAREAGHARERQGARVAAWVREHATRVALVDVGYIGYVSGVEVVDLGGVTEPAVAYAPGGYLDKRIDPGWLAAVAPDALVLHAAATPRVGEDGSLRTLAGFPVERRVAQMAWVRSRFRVDEVIRYADGTWYALLVRVEAGRATGRGAPPHP